MNYKRMIFKGQRVFVQVDDSGAPILREGRAIMKYNESDPREYSPALSNLFEVEDGGQLVLGDAGPKKAPKKKAAPPASGTFDKTTTIVAYTDGGCIGNPGPSGLGYLITFPNGEVVEKGEPLGQGTNNTAELTAIWRVLQLVEDKSAPIRIHTDSSYAIGVLTMGWKAKVNQELITRIKKTLSEFSAVTMVKVKGHAGHPENERVDKLANDSARTQKIQ